MVLVGFKGHEQIGKPFAFVIWVTVPIDALDVYTDGNGGTHVAPKVGDIWQFPDGSGTTDLQCIVTAVAPQITMTAPRFDNPRATSRCEKCC